MFRRTSWPVCATSPSCVKDLDKAAEFYSQVFELKQIGREDLDIGSAIYMSDGVINMALLNFKGKGGTAPPT